MIADDGKEVRKEEDKAIEEIQRSSAKREALFIPSAIIAAEHIILHIQNWKKTLTTDTPISRTMIMQRLSTILALSSLLLAETSAFSARKATQLSRSSPTSTSSSLHVGAVWMDDDNDSILMSRATACADGSESCSLEEAQEYLDTILKSQRDCLDATLANNPICENVDVVSDVVSKLREKIANERSQISMERVQVANVLVGVYVMSMILHGFAAVPNVPVDAPMFSAFDAFTDGINSRGVVQILPEEWFWAIRDGYFPSLFSEWIHNGGLVVDTSVFDNKVVAFTPQEWMWSIQNGSFGQMMKENMQYGGYLVDSSFDDGTIPMTMQDWMYAIKYGYFGDAVNHWFRNGGL